MMNPVKRILTVVFASVFLLMLFPLSAGMSSLPGDMDGDGRITPADARIVLRIAVGLEKIEDYMNGAPSDQDKSKVTYKIGVVQLLEHDALNANYQGFVDKINELMPGRVEIDCQNAQGEQTNCTAIVNRFVADGVDMIFAIATPAAQAAKAATDDIPIVVSCVTNPAEAGIVSSNKVPGGNLTGTSDLYLSGQQGNQKTDYYKLGVMTAEMAYDILVNGANPAFMAIRYLS